MRQRQTVFFPLSILRIPSMHAVLSSTQVWVERQDGQEGVRAAQAKSGSLGFAAFAALPSVPGRVWRSLNRTLSLLFPSKRRWKSPTTTFPTRAAENGHPFARAARIDEAEAPVIDADLSDPGWAKATVIEEFRQRLPNTGEPPTERTVLRIMFDGTISISASMPMTGSRTIISRAMARDRDIFTGDNIGITLDPGLTRRNAYNFKIGPSGGRSDMLRLNNTEELNQWDTIWDGRARRVADGWVAEIAIPFRSIS